MLENTKNELENKMLSNDLRNELHGNKFGNEMLRNRELFVNYEACGNVIFGPYQILANHERDFIILQLDRAHPYQSQCYLRTLLLLSGDIESNPGPANAATKKASRRNEKCSGFNTKDSIHANSEHVPSDVSKSSEQPQKLTKRQKTQL